MEEFRPAADKEIFGNFEQGIVMISCVLLGDESDLFQKELGLGRMRGEGPSEKVSVIRRGGWGEIETWAGRWQKAREKERFIRHGHCMDSG